MGDKFDKLDETFDVTPIESETEEIVPAKPAEIDSKKKGSEKGGDIDKDYEYTRGNLYSLIEKGQEAINGILELAQETEQPRAYEVAGQLIKNVADATDKLLDLQKKLKDVNEESVKSTTNVTNNSLFVGSTAELQKMLKSMDKKTE